MMDDCLCMVRNWIIWYHQVNYLVLVLFVCLLASYGITSYMKRISHFAYVHIRDIHSVLRIYELEASKKAQQNYLIWRIFFTGTGWPPKDGIYINWIGSRKLLFQKYSSKCFDACLEFFWLERFSCIDIFSFFTIFYYLLLFRRIS